MQATVALGPAPRYAPGPPARSTPFEVLFTTDPPPAPFCYASKRLDNDESLPLTREILPLFLVDNTTADTTYISNPCVKCVGAPSLNTIAIKRARPAPPVNWKGIYRSLSYPDKLGHLTPSYNPNPFKPLPDSTPKQGSPTCEHERTRHAKSHRYYYTRTKSDKVITNPASLSSPTNTHPSYRILKSLGQELDLCPLACVRPRQLGLYSSLDSALDAVSLFASHQPTNPAKLLQTARPTRKDKFSWLNGQEDHFHINRLPPPSLKAIRSAVNRLYRMDDFEAEHIGTGFFSEVFKVTHVITQETMVLKVNKQKSNKSNVLREIQLMNTLSHPNVLKFLGVCVNGGQLHALTEYLNGGNLEELLLNSHTQLTWPVRISLASDIAKGVAYLHAHGIFHRDLTSKNCLIRKRTERDISAVVGDLGLAAKIPSLSGTCQHTKLPIVGSPYWMAPECLQGKYYDQKADIFSFGIILCEVIARIEADPDILPRTMNFGVDYMAFSEMCVDVPPDFLELAFKCCMVDPDCRPPSFTDILGPLKIIYENAVKIPTRYNFSGHLSALRSTKGKMRRSISDQYLNVLPWLHMKSRKNYQEYISNVIDCGKDKTTLSNLSPLIFANPQHVGAIMSRDDTYYAPNATPENPFVSLLNSKVSPYTFLDPNDMIAKPFGVVVNGMKIKDLEGKICGGDGGEANHRLNFSSSTTDFDSGCSSESQDGDDDKPSPRYPSTKDTSAALKYDIAFKMQAQNNTGHGGCLPLNLNTMDHKITSSQPAKTRRVRHPLKHLTSSHQLKLLRAKIGESTIPQNQQSVPFKSTGIHEGHGYHKMSLNFFTSASCSIKAGIKKCFSCRPNTTNTTPFDINKKFNV